MFGKTAALNDRISGLDRLVDQRFNDLDRILNQRFTGQEKAIAIAEQSISDSTEQHLKSHEREHAEQSVALEKMERRFDQRLSEARVFQESIERERGDYVRRDMLAEQMMAIQAALARIERDRISPIESWRIDLTGRLMWWAFVVLFCSSLISIALVAVILSVFG